MNKKVMFITLVILHLSCQNLTVIKINTENKALEKSAASDSINNFDRSPSATNIIRGIKLENNQLMAMAKLNAVITTDDADEIETTCTATLIGPNVIITAAHCVMVPGSDPVYRQSFGPIAGDYYSVQLTVHPDYHGNYLNIPFDFAVKNDLAIGVLNKAVVGVTPATVTKLSPVINEIILYGGAGEPSMSRAVAKGKIITVSNLGVTVHTIQTEKRTEQATDHGDSGGPNFLIDKNNQLKLFAVNSTSTGRQDLTKKFSWDILTAYTQGSELVLPPTLNDQKSFLEKFVSDHQLSVCGLNRVCEFLSYP